MSNLYSLNRFIKNKTFPKQVCGRFFRQSDTYFQLQSQGLCINCFIENETLPDILEGAWVSVNCMEEREQAYLVKPNIKILTSGASEAVTLKSHDVSTLKAWPLFLNSVNQFFVREDVLHIETPSMVNCPGTEPCIKPFSIANKAGSFLITSPEMHLKKCLCYGFTDIYQITKCFRQEQKSKIHLPEFYMLEWYRAFFTLEDLKKDVQALIEYLSHQDFFKVTCPKFTTKTLSDLFKQYLKFELKPNTQALELQTLALSEDLLVEENMSFNDLFHLLFLNRIEPHLSTEGVVFLQDYPPSLRAFARINSRGWADRFECFWQGVELANAFHEVVDAKEQKQLFDSHLKERQDDVPVDLDLIHLMEQAPMPPASGIALGLDRLFVSCMGLEDISSFRLFS